ncbi:hypothetical protein MPTK1_4g05920 [Marchantia polymorpha subsp. ruderalis]|uniref:Uncharacterized protein n=2 Tax=Marchantia polymorpha TaxID=3197 RepID=A0AAF6B6T4_MARPO|nr:hypothetical protein MARPO_0114s0061 [Marchantia polymorpha]BBN07718.1 hypothetical protein Mp_4g05920 [Marchantia polymorpha subsp. ruderalis]|eukprot:PTQ31255.1 hypothetical protein MARPO_0114s0061 [Marchantia polymorpha]
MTRGWQRDRDRERLPRRRRPKATARTMARLQINVASATPKLCRRIRPRRQERLLPAGATLLPLRRRKPRRSDAKRRE